METKSFKDSDRYIAFIDLMGFKNMVLRENHSQIKSKLKDLLEFRNTALEFMGVRYEENKDPKDYEERIKSAAFSDSLIFVTKDDSLKDLKSLFRTLSLMQTYSIKENLPYKGAISHGKLTADFENSLFFGQPLIDAYHLGEQLYYYGIALDNNVERKINEGINSEKIDENHFSDFLFNHKTPLKNGNVNHYNIKFKELNKSHIQDLYNSVSGITRNYVDNTLSMFDAIDE